MGTTDEKLTDLMIILIPCQMEPVAALHVNAAIDHLEIDVMKIQTACQKTRVGTQLNRFLRVVPFNDGEGPCDDPCLGSEPRRVVVLVRRQQD